jgi:hypothetical protein
LGRGRTWDIIIEPSGYVGIIIKSSKGMADAILVNKKFGIYTQISPIVFIWP